MNTPCFCGEGGSEAAGAIGVQPVIVQSRMKQAARRPARRTFDDAFLLDLLKKRAICMFTFTLSISRTGPVHFSTPVITTPCIKTRCARKKSSTGSAIAINEAAWINGGLEP
ncbi:MAG: hypothetical protein KatS3mg048_3535 [Caldilinea sp.]|nr:MAG: hypothetical protein KatS3mg048_3535 [Caldilinea sp.]